MHWRSATRASASLATVALLALLHAGAARGAAGELVLVADTGVPSYGEVTVLVSRLGRRGPQGNRNSGRPSISADGRFVAFQSRANNLSPQDPDVNQDVYVKDLETGRLILVSLGLGGEPSNGRSGVPAISSDGHFVAFASTASNLSPDDTDHYMAFYRFELG